MKKKNIMPVAVLTVICLVVALLLAAVNMLTAPIIAERDFAATKASLQQVIPNGEFNTEPDTLAENAPETVRSVYTEKGGAGYAVVLVTNKGYTGKEIGLTVGIDTSGKIINLKITKNEESIVPQNMKPDGDYGNFYQGVSSDEVMDLETGATVKYTEGAIKNAVLDALEYLGFDGGENLPKSDSEILALAGELLGTGADTFTDVTPEGGNAVKRVYRDSTNKNYAVYTVVMSQYGTVETETLIHIDAAGTVKGIKKLVWKTSDAMYGYVPPTQEEADVFYNNVVGSGLGDIDGIEAVTNATNTTNNLKGAIKEAIEAVKADAKKLSPRDDSEILALAAELIGVNSDTLTDITPENTGTLKKLFRGDKNNYAAYTVVMSQYGTVETETLIHIDAAGTVKGIKKLVWKTSDAMYGYVPPSQEEADIFYNNVIGSGLDGIDGIEAVTNATNTTNNLKGAIKEAIEAVKADVKKNSLPRAEAEIITLAEELLGAGKGTLTDVTPAKSDAVRRIYRDSTNKNYAVYTVVMSQYGTVETETLIHIDAAGTVKGIKKLVWKTSDAMYGYVPPTQEEADVFYNNVVGSGLGGIDGIEAVTNATNTTNNLKAAIKEAIELAGEDRKTLPEPQGPRIVGSVIISVAVLSAAAAIVITKKRRAVK